jgi:putative ABC transport system ATP-binding protein
MPKTLEIKNLKKYYGTKNNITKAVNDLSLEIEEGEFVAIMGASGSGKTTLLNCISTIDEVTSGHIYIEGKDITELKEQKLASFRRQNLGFIFQLQLVGYLNDFRKHRSCFHHQQGRCKQSRP